jgi:hypothetical protein
VMYAFFRPVTGIRARRVTEPDALLRAHGFTLAKRRDSEWGLLRADLWTRGQLGKAVTTSPARAASRARPSSSRVPWHTRDRRRGS